MLKENPYEGWCNFSKDWNFDDLKINEYWRKMNILSAFLISLYNKNPLSRSELINLALPENDNKEENYKYLFKTALIELKKKIEGLTHTDWDDLRENAIKEKDCLSKEIEILNPDIIINWGWTQDNGSVRKILTQNVLGIDEKDYLNANPDYANNDFFVGKYNDKIYIEMFHTGYIKETGIDNNIKWIDYFIKYEDILSNIFNKN